MCIFPLAFCRLICYINTRKGQVKQSLDNIEKGNFKMTDYGYKMTDCGANGKAFERDLKAAFNRKAVVSKQGKVDFRKAYKNYEVKTAAGELGNYGEKLVKGVSLVLYVPVVNPALSVTEQEGFILDRVTFLECLESCGLIRKRSALPASTRSRFKPFGTTN